MGNEIPSAFYKLEWVHCLVTSAMNLDIKEHILKKKNLQMTNEEMMCLFQFSLSASHSS